MASQPDGAAALFENLQRFATQIVSHPKPKVVHHLRTTIRRVETLLSASYLRPGRNERQLLKQLRRVRRRAGRVRDVDVQVKALATLRRATRDRASIGRFLKDLRTKREGKLCKAFRGELEDGLRKRLKSTAARLQRAQTGRSTKTGVGSLALVLDKFAALVRRYPSLTERNLHAFRVDCKRLRYLAEMAEQTADAKSIVAELKRIQDAVGDWHDWLTLTATAEEVLSEQSSLLSAIRATTRSKYVEALQVTNDAKRVLPDMRTSRGKSGKPAASPRPAASEPIIRALTA